MDTSITQSEAPKADEYPLYTGEEGRFRLKIGAFLMLFSVLAFVIGLMLSIYIIMVVSILLLFIGWHLRKSGKHFLKGYLGEVRTLEVLLGIDGYVISDVVLPHTKRNIDHVFVSPYGVFAIEVKNYDADVTVNGDEWWIRKRTGMEQISSISKGIKASAFELSRIIESSTGQRIFVEPVVVFMGWGTVEGESTVPILTPEGLPEFILNRPPNINQGAVNEIVEFLEEFGHIVTGGYGNEN